jgi:AcrR family transcriptional regulator
MPGDVWHRMVDGAIRLLAKQGLQATSFADKLALTDAPRGSVYHHFPGGKDQRVNAAVDRAGARALDALDGKQGSSLRGFGLLDCMSQSDPKPAPAHSEPDDGFDDSATRNRRTLVDSGG